MECISNDQRIHTLENPNLIPRAKVNPNPIPWGFAPWDWIGIWPFAFGIFVRIFQSKTYFFNGSQVPLQSLPSRLRRSCKKSPKNPTIYVCLPKLACDSVFFCVGSPGVFITPGTYHILMSFFSHSLMD